METWLILVCRGAGRLDAANPPCAMQPVPTQAGPTYRCEMRVPLDSREKGTLLFEVHAVCSACKLQRAVKPQTCTAQDC